MNQLVMLIEVYGIFLSINAVAILMTKNHSYKKSVYFLIWAIVLNMLVLFSDMGDMIFEGETGRFSHFMMPFSNFTLFLFQHLLLVIMAYYIQCTIEYYRPGSSMTWLHLVVFVEILGILGLLITPFNGIYYYIDSANFYHRGPYFWFCILTATISVWIELFQVFLNRKYLEKKEICAQISYFLFPCIGLLFQTHFLGTSFLPIGITCSVFVITGTFEYRDIKRQKERDRILVQSRAYLLQSQIRPHFVFNSLSVIQSLIEEEPEVACDAIGHFSKYLRKNLDLKVSEAPISIWEEMDFTKNYLYMEKLRFGNKLNVKYDFQEDIDFQVPFLSVQPIVENAIRHGVRKKIEGGTVTIRVFEEKKNYVIQVADDGVGFDVTKKTHDRQRDEESNGVGVANVEERVRLLCRGSLNVISTIGVGTTVSIYIPKG